MFLTQNQQIIINNMEDVKPNISMNNNEGDIIIKEEECDDDVSTFLLTNLKRNHFRYIIIYYDDYEILTVLNKN